MKIVVEKLNEVYMSARCPEDAGIEFELADYFTFEVPNFRFTPLYRQGVWDGKIRLYSTRTRQIYLGLLDHLRKFADSRDYELEIRFRQSDLENVSDDNIGHFVDSLNLSVSVRDYQRRAISHMIRNDRSLLLSVTASGKSCMIYALVRWHLLFKRKCLILVPSTNLVEQLYSDFDDYSSKNNWLVEDNCQKLYSGHSRVISKLVLISTWQSVASIIKKDKTWVDQFEMVLCDEAHTIAAKTLTSILESMKSTRYRVGTTGTLSDSRANSLCIEGLTGPIYSATTTRDLIKQKYISDLNIKCLLLKHDKPRLRNYPDEINYQDEIDYITSNKKRNSFIRGLALDCRGNTLILFTKVEKHGKILYNMLSEANKKPVYYISGETKTDVREEIRQQISREDNAIIVASSAVLSTGVNIPSISNIIFASPYKSKIRNLQSIGRGLRLNSGKTMCNVYDIGDNTKILLDHFKTRIELYSSEKFKFKIYEIPI